MLELGGGVQLGSRVEGSVEWICGKGNVAHNIYCDHHQHLNHQCYQIHSLRHSLSQTKSTKHSFRAMIPSQPCQSKYGISSCGELPCSLDLQPAVEVVRWRKGFCRTVAVVQKCLLTIEMDFVYRIGTT